MSNRTFLAQGGSPLQHTSGMLGMPGDDHDIIAGGNCSVPLYWLSLFTREDIRLLPDAEDSDTTYPALSTPSSAAIARSRASMAKLSRSAPAAAGFTANWEIKLAAIKKPFVVIETFELYVMDEDPKALTHQIQAACDWWANPSPVIPRTVLDLIGSSGPKLGEEALMGYDWIE